MKFFLGYFALVFCLSNCATQIEQSKPNIVYVLTDDQGYGDLGCHGNPWIQTPNLDNLQSESVTFTNFHVGTTCAPSRSGLMSGNNCNRVGAWHTIMGRSMLSDRFRTLPQYLQEAGYSTGIFGKWHLGDNYPYRPQDRGFDEVLVHGGGGVGQTPDYWNNDYFDDTYFLNGEPQKYEGYCTDIWFEESIKFIKKSKEMGEPFFAYIATNAPHGPYHVPQKYIDMYSGNENIPNPNFYGMITNVDENVGKLEKALEEMGLRENTIFIYMTDNGTSSGANFDKGGQVVKGFNADMRAKKGSEYDGGHRVPFFIRFPKSMEIAKQSFSQLTSYVDFMPTVLDLLGIESKADQKFDGLSLKPLLTKGSDSSLDNRILVADTQREEWPKKWKNASVMQANWRLVNNKELYDLAKDPSQKENLIEQFPEKGAELSQGYENWWESIQEDIKKENYLHVGAKQENPVILTAHDWHSKEAPPWNQNHIREDFIGNGHWLIKVEESGKYKIKLFRWAPSLMKAMNENVKVGDPVEGGTPYNEGIGATFSAAKLKIGDLELSSSSLPNPAYFEFEMALESGPNQLQTWLTDINGKERGAFYVQLEKL
ncbi:Arylsulfatase A [Spirosomataceae bacterium TFI 002]|nr:Arylsulfatase A [Spirosomataceae bacterium TFI 002]